MATRISLRDIRDSKTWKLVLGQRNVFELERWTAHVLELEDVFFNHNSAVLLPEGPDPNARSTTKDDEPLPDEGDATNADDDPPGPEPSGDITGLSVLTATYRHAEGNPAQKLLVVGHTDTSGEVDYNERLSRERAACVIAVLEGNHEGFVEIAQEWGKVEDYQTILNWLATRLNWPCPSGEVDNKHGSTTDGAVRAFQNRYNNKFLAQDKKRLNLPGPEDKLVVDGDVGKKTWGAFFDLYIMWLCDLMKVDHTGMETWRSHLSFLDPKSVGCGEAHPIRAEHRDGYRSQRNRRTELLFFLDEEKPDLGKCHSGETCSPDTCELYKSSFYRLLHLPPDPDASQAYDYDVEFRCHLPKKVGPAELSLEPATIDGKPFVEGDRLNDVELRYIVRDDHSVPLAENDAWLGNTGTRSKLDNYQKLGIMPTIEPRVPFRLAVRRKMKDGSFGEIHEGMVHLELYIEDPAVDLAAHTRPKKATKFVQDVLDLHKHADGDDNAPAELGGQRPSKAKLVLKDLLATYDGNDATKGAAAVLDAPKAGEPFKLDAPASTVVDGVHESTIDLCLTPAITLGDNFRLRVKVVEDPKLEFTTKAWTHWKRIRIDGVVNVGSPKAIDYERVRAVYRASFMELEAPAAAQTVTLTEAEWKTALKKYFATTSETIKDSEYKYGTYMLPDHKFKSKGVTWNHGEGSAKALLDAGLKRIPSTRGFVVLYTPTMHPDYSTLNGFSMGDKRVALHDRGQPAINLASTLAHEMGHSVYLRHAYTTFVSVKSGTSENLVKVGGDLVMSSRENCYMQDHDPVSGSSCIMSYFRNKTTAKYCGVCQLNLGMYDKTRIAADPGVLSMRRGAWGVLELYDKNYTKLAGAVSLAASKGFQFRFVTDREPGGKHRRDVTELATWASSDPTVFRPSNKIMGRYTAVSTGTATVTATLDGNTVTHNVVVT